MPAPKASPMPEISVYGAARTWLSQPRGKKFLSKRRNENPAPMKSTDDVGLRPALPTPVEDPALYRCHLGILVVIMKAACRAADLLKIPRSSWPKIGLLFPF
jgi:hypothetical protein